MAEWTRRELMQVGMALGGSAILPRVNLSPVDNEETGAATTHVGKNSITGGGCRRRSNLDLDWRFHFGHAAEPAQDFSFDSLELYAKTGLMPGKTGTKPSVFQVGFDDSNWRSVDLPHDWAVELSFEDAPNNQGVMSHGWKPLGRAYPATSIGWYRRCFHTDQADSTQRTFIEFEGIMRDAVVMLNGCYLGRHESGYVPARFDVTDFLNYGGDNALVLRVDATQGEGWFYEGAGIYRHVWMTTTSAVHVASDGVFVTTKKADSGIAQIEITTEVVNDSNTFHPGADLLCRVHTKILDDTGAEIASAMSDAAIVAVGAIHTFTKCVYIAEPKLWSLDAPNLYRAVTSVESEGVVQDICETSFGVRTIAFDADCGFLLNGKPVRIQGTSNHQDHAGVGAAVPDAVQRYRIMRLKEIGCNAYRSAHNPPSPALLDNCDRFGMLVMDEMRSLSSAPYAMQQLETIVRRDRNHPSVVIWSLGNEEQVVQSNDHGVRIVLAMKQRLRQLDPTRPCTVAMNEKSWGKGISYAVDVQGFNYASDNELDAFHKLFPKLPMIGTETASMVSTRGIYQNDDAARYVSAYDVNKRPWSEAAEEWVPWYGLRPFVCGGFAWTGFDYRGEPSPYWKWPNVSSHFGILDSCGFPKDTAWYYKAWWGKEPVLHMYPHWDWKGQEGSKIEVWIQTNLEEVELILNGVSQGRKLVVPYKHLAWSVTYQPGAIEALGYRGGNIVMRQTNETTGAPAALKLKTSSSALRANGADVAVVDVEVQDGQGRFSPQSNALITFDVTGPGRVIGVGNGNPTSLEPDKAAVRKAFNGLCQAIVQAGRAPGTIRITARSAGFRDASLVLACFSAK